MSPDVFTVSDSMMKVRDSFNGVWAELSLLIPMILFALFIFIVGWIIASLLGKAVAQIVRSLKIDHALRGANLEHFLKRAGFNLDSGAFIGGLVEWFFIVVTLLAVFDILQLRAVNELLGAIALKFLPQVFVSSLIILAAALIAEAVEKTVTGVASAGGIRSARFAGVVARYSIWIFAILLVLTQLGVGVQLIQILFTGVVVALAIGLGGQQAASSFIEKVRQDIAEHHRN